MNHSCNLVSTMEAPVVIGIRNGAFRVSTLTPVAKDLLYMHTALLHVNVLNIGESSTSQCAPFLALRPHCSRGLRAE